MNAIESTLNGIIARAEQAQERSPEDYVQDGLLYCGACHRAKQLHFGKYIVPCLCKCGEEKLKAEEEAKKRKKRLEFLESLKRQSLMDSKFYSQSFESWQDGENEKQKRICRRYAEAFDKMLESNQGLLLYGEKGTGKTFAAACIANYLLSYGVPVVMTSFVRLLEQSFREDEDDTMQRLNRAKLLIIDDLGAERGTDYALERVYAIIDNRYRANLPMILTTNLSPGEMKNINDIRYERIYDRIFEICYPVQFAGASFRRREAVRRFGEMKEILEGE